MTSREALENIKSRINSISLFPKVNRKTYDESWETIEKDLEMLDEVRDLIKKCINLKEKSINVLYLSDYIEFNDSFKEWLNNE